MNATACPACDAPTSRGLRDWHRRCTRCSWEGSTLEPRIGDGGGLDESLRETGLETLRRANFRRLAARLDGLAGTTPSPTLLDVGCAHGWFLQATAGRFAGLGIEPDAGIAATAVANGATVRIGLFPDVVADGERFDVIAFNDVLEHIPDVHAALAACARHLAPGGVVMVNAPSRRGVFYRVSKGLARAGRAASFERMWQVGFPSPHVHYFDADSLAAIAARHGFVLHSRLRLPSVTARGLYARIRYAGDVPRWRATLMTAAITAMVPALALLPADIETWFLRRAADGASAAE